MLFVGYLFGGLVAPLVLVLFVCCFALGFRACGFKFDVVGFGILFVIPLRLLFAVLLFEFACG